MKYVGIAFLGTYAASCVGVGMMLSAEQWQSLIIGTFAAGTFCLLVWGLAEIAP